MMEITCPLSKSTKLNLIEEVTTKDLNKQYQKMLGSDISKEFGQTEKIGLYHCLDSDLRFFYPTITASESFYEKLQKFDWYYLDEKEEYNYASQYIKSSHSVLEIGCGKGAFREKMPVKTMYVGLEFSQKATELGQQKKITILNQSIQQHSVDFPETHDIVCAFQVLEHIGDLDSFIQASLKCLKPGGLLIYSVPSADSFVSLAKNNILNMPPHHVTWWSDQSLEYIGKKYNLKVIELHHEKLSDIHKTWYASTLASISLYELLKISRGNLLIDQRFFPKILNKLANLIGRILALGLKDYRVLPCGHSVTSVYQKL
ncbi:class I SAM-dependent methyltransferase [Dolichospermum circinale]|uniref:class I SAM-dependent methyltransferase n=1 Tax=Dolichospermum circinale TaxID=109265 RepID=UPI00232BC8B2|nr:class I SAM-dependent methyltransferase [Dolichospermum circinale]MDB9454096.1 class I SAM-dependent methyltransferase [Dolichospermum circinale CS-541/06]MDB9460858.1 class I SAM-dependent methyltransferase [Dolichospermum circinale CS-541/04]MDB9549569.1 class I SAM-dependent methyltransferase [Dolichospermum circinale CS-1031]